ncbi:unnamed protein product, partial [Iphiclides podalirius]
MGNEEKIFEPPADMRRDPARLQEDAAVSSCDSGSSSSSSTSNEDEHLPPKKRRHRRDSRSRSRDSMREMELRSL